MDGGVVPPLMLRTVAKLACTKLLLVRFGDAFDTARVMVGIPERNAVEDTWKMEDLESGKKV